MNARSNTGSALHHAGGEALPPRRRQYSAAFKLQVLREIMRPGASIASVALRHNMNCNVIFRWRREYRAGELVSDEPLQRPPADENPFIAVGVIDDRGAVAMLPPPEKDDDKQASAAQGRSRIEIIMPNGICIRVDGQMDDSALRRLFLFAKELP
jgi:transposase